MHSALPGAQQSQHSPPVAPEIDAAMAEGKQLSARGDLPQALARFERCASLAKESGDVDREARALLAVSAAATRLRRYSVALDAALRAKPLAITEKDFAIAGGASVNVSAVFNQLGDFDRARQEALDAVGYLKNSPNKKFCARASLSLALLDYRRGDNVAGEAAFDEAIRAAQAAKDDALEAAAWDERGILLLDEQAELPGTALLRPAEESLRKAYQIREKLKDDYGLSVTKEHLAELQLEKPDGDVHAALKLINEAMASPTSRVSEGVPYYPIHVKARILQKLGDPAALSEFRRAALVASEWRRTALPGDTTNTQTVAAMHDVYADFALAAADASLRRKNPALAREALEVLAENRAANLREELAATYGRNLRLPESYFSLLQELKEAQGKILFGAEPARDQAQLQNIQRRLQDLEIKIGISNRNLDYSGERKSLKNSLRSIQGRLGSQQVLISFCLGNSQSFLWAVTREQLHLYRLRGQSAIEEEAKAFTTQVPAGTGPADAGYRLSADLFGQLPADIWAKPEWLLVADGGLLDRVPFPALPAGSKFLSTNHSLRFLPSELLLLDANESPVSPRFVGIGDPIYNLADARRRTSLVPVSARSRPALSLARLAGSGRELTAAAKMAGLPYELLTGIDATGSRVSKALANKPEIIHIAAHIVSPDGQPQRAAIALSLTAEGIPELLTPEVVAAFRVPGSVVVLSGCSSEQGQVVPSEGMTGLSRAWLLAGAAAVIVSAWPTPDDSGAFFSSFYRHFRTQRPGTPARRATLALAESQSEMQSDHTYRSSPAFWAAYSIISKE
ncbi:MAG: CHAT domain-containing protein [Acidobacteriaceae bacterium]|nr:CHAT domain-containing protein [Acidobacteriaceae bacterium]